MNTAHHDSNTYTFDEAKGTNDMNIDYNCYVARGRTLRSRAVRDAFMSISRRFLTPADHKAPRVERDECLPQCAPA